MASRTDTDLPPARRGLREVERRLERHGLLRGPRRLLTRAHTAPTGVDLARRLRATLEELGPVFAAFGRYLASRADLFSASECFELAAIRDQAPPVPVTTVLDRVSAELGHPAQELFPEFESHPTECRLFHQSHRARMNDGTPVQVRVISPDAEARIETDLPNLLGLDRALPASEVPLGELVDDFRRSLTRRLDLSRQADAFEAIAAETSDSALIAVPRVYKRWSTARVLTATDLGGRNLDEIGEHAVEAGSAARRHDLARRISLVWCQLALGGRLFPLEATMSALSDGRLALTGGDFAELSAGSKINLWDYLRATASHQPEQACDYLLRELSRGPRAVSERELHLQLRQAVPFRSGGWSKSGDSLAEHILLHWRLATDAGYRSGPELLAFFRGLFWTAWHGQRLDPSGDPFEDGLDALQWLGCWTQFRHLTSPERLGEAAESFMIAAVDLPQKLDRVLTLATQAGRPEQLDARSPARALWNSSIAVAALLIAMVALALLARQVLGAGLFGEWGGPLVTLVFLALGGCVLWVMRSGRGKP